MPRPLNAEERETFTDLTSGASAYTYGLVQTTVAGVESAVIFADHPAQSIAEPVAILVNPELAVMIQNPFSPMTARQRMELRSLTWLRRVRGLQAGGMAFAEANALANAEDMTSNPGAVPMDTDKHLWTLAYRKPSANRFQRVNDWAGTWHEAVDASSEFGARHPGYEVWFVPTRAADLAGYSVPEDRGNILTHSGRRVRMVDTGTINGPDGDTLRTMADRSPAPWTDDDTDATDQDDMI